MAYQPDINDPFYGGEKVPSLSWKGLPVGSTFTLEVLEEAKSLQSRNFETNALDYWDEEKQRPKMSAVLNVMVKAGPHSVGEMRSIWAQIPSNLFIALKEAQKVAEAKFQPGGILHVKFTGEVPHENKKYNAIKQYAAKYDAPAARAADPFAQPAQAAQPAQTSWGNQPAKPVTPATSGTATW